MSLNRTQFRLAEIPTASPTKVNWNLTLDIIPLFHCDCYVEPGKVFHLGRVKKFADKTTSPRSKSKISQQSEDKMTITYSKHYGKRRLTSKCFSGNYIG